MVLFNGMSLSTNETIYISLQKFFFQIIKLIFSNNIVQGFSKWLFSYHHYIYYNNLQTNCLKTMFLKSFLIKFLNALLIFPDYYSKNKSI